MNPQALRGSSIGLALLSVLLRASGAGPNGTDIGWTVDHNTGQIYLTSTLANQLSQGEVGWVRVEMSLVKGHTNWDATMLGYYDTVINNAHSAGLQVSMLIDGGSWPGSQTDWCTNNSENNPGADGDNPYVESFATNAVLPLVQHFRDRVKIYELWNEPNCWSSSPSNGVYAGCTFIYPSNYGWMLARSWEAVHALNHYNDVTLFSGGVFGHNIGGVSSYVNAGAQYIDDTYSTGTNAAKAGAFRYTKTNYNAYPLDGIGQHIYLNPGGVASSNTFRQYEDWVHQAMMKYEEPISPKKTFITEFGWQTTNASNNNGVSMGIQDTNLVTAFSAVQAASYVKMAIWFQWKDNPAGSLWYGVLDSSNNPKLAYPDFLRFERYEGMDATGLTNDGIQTYFSSLGQAVLGSPFDNDHGAWVYAFENGYAQDYAGGSHSRLTLLASSNGVFELNDLHGFWSYFQTNNGISTFGYVLDNAFSYGSAVRQDFTQGYLSWDAVNQVEWHPLLSISPSEVLSWLGAYTLQSASNLSGPWNDVTNAVSPYTNTTTDLSQQFFRLRN